MKHIAPWWKTSGRIAGVFALIAIAYSLLTLIRLPETATDAPAEQRSFMLALAAINAVNTTLFIAPFVAAVAGIYAVRLASRLHATWAAAVGVAMGTGLLIAIAWIQATILLKMVGSDLSPQARSLLESNGPFPNPLVFLGVVAISTALAAAVSALVHETTFGRNFVVIEAPPAPVAETPTIGAMRLTPPRAADESPAQDA